MSAKPRPRVLAVGSDQAFETDAAWTGGADLALAGEAVAGEILRQVVIGRLGASHDRAASRRSR